MEAVGLSVRSSLGRQLAAREWAAVIGPKALAGRKLRPLGAAIVAIAIAVLLYRIQREAGFAVLAVVAGAAGWLLSTRPAGVVAVAEVAGVAGSVWWGFVPWPAALFQVCLLLALIGLAHVAAERQPVVDRSALQQRRIDGLTLLLETAESLAAAADRDEILNIAVRATQRGISRSSQDRAAHAAFHSVVGEQLNISVVADEPDEREIALGFEYPTDRNKAATGAIRIGRPAFVRPDHMTGTLRELAGRSGWQVLIMAPVYSGGSLQGLLAATGRDSPVVDSLQQYMLGTLARLTSSSLESATRAVQPLAAEPETAASEIDMPMLLPAIVKELRAAVQPIKSQVLDLRASKNRGNSGDEVAHTFGKLDELISALASRTAIDSTTGVLSRELGLEALERDVLRARRSQTRKHSVAVLRVAASEAHSSTELIRLVADRLRAGLRREDLIFRNSEDEFVCSFADMDSADAQRILSRIQTELAREIGYTPFTIGLTSVGLEQTAG